VVDPAQREIPPDKIKKKKHPGGVQALLVKVAFDAGPVENLDQLLAEGFLLVMLFLSAM